MICTTWSFFRKVTCTVKNLVGVTWNALLTVVSLLNMDASPYLIKKHFLPIAWKESVNLVQPLQLWTNNCEILNIEGIVLLFITIGDLRVRALLVIFEILVVDILLRTSSTDQYIRSIFWTERKVMFWRSGSMVTISTKESINSIYTDITVFNEITEPLNYASKED